MVIAQIETDEGLRNVEAIAAVPGIDALWIGHFDLTNFMGIPGQFQHPAYLAAVDRVVAACAAHGQDRGDPRYRRHVGARLRRQGFPSHGVWHRPGPAAERAASAGSGVLRDACR